MVQPTFSVIVPVYNRPHEITELLKSLTLQTRKDFEVLLVEDGSTITSEKVYESYSRYLSIQYFFKPNSGPGPSRNLGFEKARGKYFVVFDSDCIIPPGYFESVENYRRDLDLATATARVSYVAGGVTFSREVFASAPDQVIVVRLTASRPGQISFEARLRTPQRATVEATAEGDLVMRGVNGDGAGATADGRPMTGALRFEARVRVLPTGGTRTASGDAQVVRGADAVTSSNVR